MRWRSSIRCLRCAIERGELDSNEQFRYLPELLVGVLFTPLIVGRTDFADEQTLLGYLHTVILPLLHGAHTG